MMQFIQNLNEARFFRYQDNFDGKRVSNLASTLYYLMLMIEVLRRFDNEYAVRYCKQTFTSISDARNIHTAVSMFEICLQQCFI